MSRPLALKHAARRFVVYLLICTALATVIAIETPVRSDAAGTWSSQADGCSNGGVSKRSTYTTCYQRYKKANDGSTKEDYFFYRMTLSGYALKGNVTTKMWVEPKPTTTGMSWYTSDPFEPDSTTTASSGCVTVSASIGGGEVPASLGASTDICNKEQFTFKLYNDAGHHAGVLTANCIPANSGRKVYATALVKTTQNNVAGWSTAYRGMDVRTVVAGC